MKAAGTLLASLAIAGLIVAAPASADDLGAAIGGGVGAVAGALIGDSMRGRNGAIVGSGIGGAVGAVVGNRVSRPTGRYDGNPGYRLPVRNVEHHHYYVYPAHPGRGHAYGHYKPRHRHYSRHDDRQQHHRDHNGHGHW